MPTSSKSTVMIQRLVDVDNTEAFVPGIDAVFFSSSGTKTFEDEAARAAFRARWLGRFLDHDRRWAYVALDDSSRDCNGAPTVVGYLVGALEDPATASRFADLTFFQAFKRQTQDYPAQLHVNLTEDVRGHGHGGRLIEAFVNDAQQHGACGVHVVTGAEARNVAFYKRCGFDEVARAEWNNSSVVFLGRRL